MFYPLKKGLFNFILLFLGLAANAQDSIPDIISVDPKDFAALPDSLEDVFGGSSTIGVTTPLKALVIGIADYKFEETLSAPVNDAKVMAELLRKSNWYVAGYENLKTKQSFIKVVEDFKKKLNPQDQAILYFSGHGFQYNGKNYLVPALAHISNERDIETQAYALDITRILGKAKCKVVILDACRNNLQSGTKRIRGLTPGLKLMTRDIKPSPAPANAQNPDLSAGGTLIAYASAFGKPATDGKRYSVFTGALYKVLQKSPPCTSFTDILQEARGIVIHQTRQKQVPWDSSSLTGKFVLKPCQ